MTKKNYYEILGISKTATTQEIKKAYKRLAMKYHPDRNQGDKTAEHKFKEIKKAYEVLNNPKTRSSYDQYGDSAFEQTNFGGFSTNNNFGDIFDDVFGDIFGSGKRQRSTKGQDLQYNISLTLEESVRGISKKIQIPTLKTCNLCKGHGTKIGTHPETCFTCHGEGQIQIRQGFFAVQQTCPSCYGKGNIIKNPCKQCNGNGKTKTYKTLLIKIPSGVNTGDRIKLNGEGESNKNDSYPGDLYIQINVINHEIFDRKGANLYCEVPINFVTAALGGRIDVPTLDGKISLKIPSETQTGKIFRIKGKGIKPIQERFKGDLMCKIIVETPIKLNTEQKILLKKFGNSLNGASAAKNTPRSKSFLDRVKKFFDSLTK